MADYIDINDGPKILIPTLTTNSISDIVVKTGDFIANGNNGTLYINVGAEENINVILPIVEEKTIYNFVNSTTSHYIIITIDSGLNLFVRDSATNGGYYNIVYLIPYAGRATLMYVGNNTWISLEAYGLTD